MSEALKRARHEVAGRLEAAKDDFDAMNRRTAAQSNRDGERRAEWAARIEEDQATLDAIDAAIAAEAEDESPLASLKPARPTIEIGFPFGDGEELKLRATVEDLKELLGGFATGGIVGADVEPGLVGERAGEAVVSGDPRADRRIQIGDIVQLTGEFKVVSMREDPSPFRILNGPCFEEVGPADVVYTVQRKASTGYLVGDELEVLAEGLRRL